MIEDAVNEAVGFGAGEAFDRFWDVVSEAVSPLRDALLAGQQTLQQQASGRSPGAGLTDRVFLSNSTARAVVVSGPMFSTPLTLAPFESGSGQQVPASTATLSERDLTAWADAALVATVAFSGTNVTYALPLAAFSGLTPFVFVPVEGSAAPLKTPTVQYMLQPTSGGLGFQFNVTGTATKDGVVGLTFSEIYSHGTIVDKSNRGTVAVYRRVQFLFATADGVVVPDPNADAQDGDLTWCGCLPEGTAAVSVDSGATWTPLVNNTTTPALDIAGHPPFTLAVSCALANLYPTGGVSPGYYSAAPCEYFAGCCPGESKCTPRTTPCPSVGLCPAHAPGCCLQSGRIRLVPLSDAEQRARQQRGGDGSGSSDSGGLASPVYVALFVVLGVAVAALIAVAALAARRPSSSRRRALATPPQQLLQSVPQWRG